MICLGIESTAHTFGIGIVNDKCEILANVKDMYQPKKGGIHPREAADHHSILSGKVLRETLEKSGVELRDIDLISFSQGPGLPQCLKIGAVVGRSLSLKLNKPLVGVNHCIAHIEIGKKKTNASDPVTLYVSGGNTQVLAFVEGRYRCFGETLDIAIGNCLDQFARSQGLKHPGGPKIEKLAKNGKWIGLPYVVKGMDLSFSGILTEAIKKAKTNKLEDVCFSLQETCYSMLTEVVERAVAHTDKEEVLLTGGVAASERLREMLSIMCKERGAKLYSVPKEYSGDNGSMIAWAGILAHNSGSLENDTKIRQKWRTDDVVVGWI